MITVVAKNYISDDGIEEMKRITEVLVNETRNEEGCIKYALFQDVEEKGIFTFIEEWASQEALEKHMKTAHFIKIVPQIEGISLKEAEVNILKNIY